MPRRTLRSRIVGLTSMRPSRRGNPRWLVLLEDGVRYRTRPDGRVAARIDRSLIGARFYVQLVDGVIVDLVSAGEDEGAVADG